MPPPTPSKPAINPATTPAATMAPAKARSISIPYSNVDHLENITQRNQVDTNLVLKEPLRYQGTGVVSSCTHVSCSASKAAVIQFAKTTAAIHAAKGIRVNCVVPGLLHTPLVNCQAKEYASGNTPSGRAGHQQSRRKPMRPLQQTLGSIRAIHQAYLSGAFDPVDVIEHCL